MWSDTVLIVFISLCTAFLGEGKCTLGSDDVICDCENLPSHSTWCIFNLFTGLTWVLVYRTEKFQKLKGEIEKQSKKCKHDILCDTNHEFH